MKGDKQEREKDKKRLVILDTHAILHRAYHALPDFSSTKGEPTGGLYGLVSMLVKIINDLKPDYIVAAIDLPGDTFRDLVYKEYKGTRAKTDDALISQLKRAPEVLRALGIEVYSAKTFEADDVIGTIVEKMKKNKDVDLIIASGDMDALQLVDDERVRVFTLKKGLNDTMLYDERGVNTRYGFGPQSIPDYKGLRGDPSDNIPGVKGVGEKTATTLIVEFGTVENLYKELKKNPEKFVALGVKQGMIEKLKEHKEDALFSKMLAEIRRDVPVDFKLPKKAWREGVDVQKTLAMLNEFDFRSLIPRIKQVLQKDAAESPLQSSFTGVEIPREEFEQAALSVWVLDSGITNPSLDDIYRTTKTDNIEDAKKQIAEEIKKRKLEFIYDQIELPLVPVLRRMESRGVLIDRAFLDKLSKEYTRELQILGSKIYQDAGQEFNINSPKQLGEILFDQLGLALKNQKKTAGGQRSTRESELEKMKSLHPVVEKILQYRELQKLLSTYIDTIPTLLDKNDRLHTHFLQTGTSTGRLGSENPNVQNIPIKSDLGRAIREAFVADKGYMLVAFDYSQIELRIAAFLSGDEGLAQIFKNGRDVHREVAARVFHVREEEVNYEQRRRAKVINFGILYGMGVNSLQQALGTSRAEAQTFYNGYFEAFPRLAAYIDEVKADAARKGYTQTHFGRRRYFDGIKSPIPYVRAAAERMAINAPIQGTQADLVKLAMIKIDELFEKEANVKGEHKAYMLLQVHDELVFEIQEKLVDTLAPKIKEIMEEIIPEKERHSIPFIAEGKVGKNWGEMKAI
jgi:DNA polymerase-1